MSFGMTAKQSELLTFLRSRRDAGGPMPSLDEMRVAVDLRSKSGVSRIIAGLESRGLIRRLPHLARAVELIDQDTTVVDPTFSAALRAYCAATGKKPDEVIASALVQYFRANPPEAAP